MEAGLGYTMRQSWREIGGGGGGENLTIRTNEQLGSLPTFSTITLTLNYCPAPPKTQMTETFAQLTQLSLLMWVDTGLEAQISIKLIATWSAGGRLFLKMESGQICMRMQSLCFAAFCCRALHLVMWFHPAL